MNLIEVRKLAALDMSWLGPRVIITEHALGVIGPLALGAFTLGRAFSSPGPSPWVVTLGVWLVGIAANYGPLLLYAVAIARAGTTKSESDPERANVRRYGVQQAMILVPLLIVVLAFAQESSRHR